MFDYYTIFASGLINTVPLDFSGNAGKLLKLAQKAKEGNYKFIAFPELSLCGFNCGDLAATREFAAANLKALLSFKEQLPDSLTVGVGAALKANDGNSYDCYVVLDNKNILDVFAVRDFQENTDARRRAYSENCGNAEITIGSESFKLKDSSSCGSNIVSCQGINVGIYFNSADLASVVGADVIVAPSAVRYELDAQEPYEQSLLDLSAKLNCMVLTANLMGCESGSDIFDGCFYLCNQGKLIARSELLPFERTKLANKDLGIVGRLPEFDTIVRAVSLGLFDWMAKTYSHGYALSLSGGADSGLCATCVCYGQLAALKALGYDGYYDLMTSLGFEVPKLEGDLESFIKNKMMPQVLTTVYQGSEVSGSVTRTAALKLAKNIGAQHYEWSIASLVRDYVNIINGTTPDDPLNWERDDLTLQNIQARVRSPGIWMIANRYNKLLMTTCNSSEDAVGYCTMDGDTSGGVAPIGDIAKSRILKINAYIAKEGLKIDSSLHLEVNDMSYISAQAPTAELKPGQTDERDLMPYVLLDRIHNLHQIEKQTPAEIVKSLIPEYSQYDEQTLRGFVVKYFTRLARNQWKRERGATTFHIEKADLNAKTGFVFPLLNDGYKSLLADLVK